MEFRPSPGTLGLESELQLLNPQTLQLVDGVLPLMRRNPDPAHVGPEFIQNTVEIRTDPFRSVSALGAQLVELGRSLSARCRELGMVLCGSGTHAYSLQLARLTPQPRYLRMAASGGLLTHLQVTFATHVHVGMASGDQAVLVMNALEPLLPVLIAVSANSPFWHGYDTGHACFRQRILAASRSYGLPPRLRDWAEFVALLEAARRAEVFADERDVHWDLRPRGGFGTLEVRVMDAQPVPAYALQLAAFVRALAVHLASTLGSARTDGLPAEVPWWARKENYYQAGHLGLGARFVRNASGDTLPLQVLAEQALEVALSAADALGEGGYVRELRARVRAGELGYRLQRRLYAEQRSLRGMTAELSRSFEAALQSGHLARARATA